MLKRRAKLDNKRKVERKHLIYYLKVTDLATDQVIGHVVNVSNEGVMLISEKPIQTELNFQLQMFLPEEIQGSRYFGFDATSKWCEADENPDFYNIGFELSNVSADSIQVIQRLIDKFCFK
jgi:PilZ domain